MKIGRYEFGWIQPIHWHKFWKTNAENPCGCTIWEWGFWYFTILRYGCAGEPDPRAEILKQSIVETAALEAMKTKLPVSKSEMKRLNVLKGRPMMEGLKTTTNKKKRRKKRKVKKN